MSLNTTPRTYVAGETMTAAIMNTEVRDALIGVQAAWTAYTPALTATTTNPTLGTGSAVSGRYMRIGKTVIGWAQINFGNPGFAAGSGIYRVSLPVTALTATFVGDGRIQCAGGFTRVQPLVVTGAQGQVSLRYYAAAGAQPDATNALPNVWLNSDEIRVSFAYEAA